MGGQPPREVQGAGSARHRDPHDERPRLDHGGAVAAVADGLQLDVLQVVEALRPGDDRRELQEHQGPRCPLRGLVPRFLRPEGPGRGDDRGRDRRRGDLQRSQHRLERHQALPRSGARPRLLQGLQRLDGRVPGVRPGPARVQRDTADDGHRRLHRRAAPHRRPRPAHRAARGLPERRLRDGLPRRRPLLGRGRRARHAHQCAPAVLLPRRRPRVQGDRRRRHRPRSTRQAPSSSTSRPANSPRSCST